MIGVKIVQNIQTIYIRLKLDSPKILIMLANGILEKSQLYLSFLFFIANIVEEPQSRNLHHVCVLDVIWLNHESLMFCSGVVLCSGEYCQC